MSPNHVIITRVLTEKSTSLERLMTYVFEVSLDANKYQIFEAVQSLYGIKPVAVRIVSRPPQTKRVGKARREVHTSKRKFAYVKTEKPLENLKKIA